MFRRVLMLMVVIGLSGCGAPETDKQTQTRSVRDVKSLRGELEVERLLSGIPQKAARLGDAAAPVTITEFIDPRCEQCARYSTGTGKIVIDRMVRPGSAQVVYQVIPALGEISYPAVTGALAAAQQDHMAFYIELFFRNQPSESASVDIEPILSAVSQALPGLDQAAFTRARSSKALLDRARANRRLAKRAKLKGVPTIIVSGPRDSYVLEGTVSFAQVRRAVRIVQNPGRPDQPASPLIP